MDKTYTQDSSKKSSTTQEIITQFGRLTRVMAVFTAGSLFVSPNEARAAQSHELNGHKLTTLMQAHPDLSKREARQMRRDLRQENRAARITIPSMTPGFVPNPDPNFQPSRNEGNDSAKLQQRFERRSDKLAPQVTQNNNCNLVKLDNGANLDMTSSDRNITLGDKLFGKADSATITVGGETKTVSAGDKVTAAEYIAVKQSLNGEQSIVVDNSGKATGGQVDLNTIAATKNTMKADSLTIASGVTAVGDLDKNSSFKLDGDLTNYGSVYAVNSGNSHKEAEIAADNITNASGALISSNAGSSFGNKADSIDLSLTSNNFSNLGTVESSGNLTITAGNVTNAGTVSAARDLTLDSPGTLNVNNIGGTLKATDAINVRTSHYRDSFNTAIVGGDLLSSAVNLNTGNGTVDVDVNQLTGTLNGAGTAAHVTTNTENLTLGEICLEGDPTFFNTGAITISGNITASQDIAIIAETNIVASAGANITITANNGAGGGSNLFMIAGFDVTAGGGAVADGALPPGTPIIAGQTVTVDNGGALGGNIDLTAANSVNLVTAAPLLGQNAGNVTLLARAVGAGTGSILLPTSSMIQTFAVGAGQNNGNITVAAGSNASAVTIQLGSLQATGGAGTLGGVVNVTTRQPSATPVAGVVFNNLGQIQSGAFAFGGTNANPGILIGDGVVSNVNSGGNLTINSGAFGTTLNLGAGGLFTDTGNLSINTTGTLNVNAFAAQSFSGGNLSFVGNTGVNIAVNPLTGLYTPGGDITVTAAGGSASITCGGIFTGGGDVSISAAGSVSINGGGNQIQILTLGPAAGGNVTIEADSNNNGLGNLFATDVSIDTSALGGSGFSAGNIQLDSGDDVGQVLQIGGLVALGSFPGAGGNVSIGTLTGDAGDITINGQVLIAGNGGGILTIDADTNDHSVTFNSGITASAINIDIDTAAITMNNASYIQTDSYNVIASTFTATAFPTLFIQTLSPGTSVGLAGGAGTLNLSTAELNQFVTTGLEIDAYGATVTLGSSLDVSGVGPGKYNLTFYSGQFNGGANNINLGDKSFQISASGDVTIGNITGTTGSIFIGTLAPNNVTTGVLSTTSGGIFASANGALTVAGVNTTTADVNLNGTSVTVTGPSTGTTGDFIVNASGNITVGSVILTGAGADILLTSFAGNITTTGTLQADPIVMIAPGTISLGGSLIANDGILVVAGQDIVSTAAMNIDASNGAGTGGAVTMVAGADYTNLGIPVPITINGSSSTGGSILLNNLGTLTTEGSVDGGDIYLVAYSNGAAGGKVILPLTSSTRTTGTVSGDFNVIAGSLSGVGIQTGVITTSTFSNDGSGVVLLHTTSPSGGVDIDQPSAVVTTSGAFLGGAIQGSSIQTANITARGSNVTAFSGSNVGLGAVNVSAIDPNDDGGTITVEATGTDTMDIGSAAGSNYIASVSLNGGSTSGDGGFLDVTNHGSSGMRVAPIAIAVVDGAGGSIDLDAEDGNIQLNAGTFSTNGAGATGNAGSITLNGSGVTVSGGNVALSNNRSGSGIGGAVSITTSGPTNLNLGTGSGQVQISTTGLGSSVNLNIGGTINQTSTGSLDATIINLVTSLPGSDVILNGTNTGNFLFIDSADAITIGAFANPLVALNATAVGNITTVGAGLVQTSTTTLTSTGGNIGNNQFARFNINTSSLAANAFSGSVFLNDTNAINILGASTAANTFDLQAGGAITQTVGGTIGANNVVLRSTGSTITLTETVTGGSSVSLRSSGALTNTVAGTVVAPSIALRSDNSTVGTAPGSRFEIDSDFVTATANGLTGSAFIHDANSVDIGPGPSSATLIFDVLADGNITNSGTITAADVVLNTGGSFNISNLIIGSNSISLTSVGSITNGNLAGTLIAPQINLTTLGNIGSSALSRFTIDAGSLTLTAAGNVFVFDSNQINIGPTASSAGGTFDILAGSDITTDGSITSTNLVLRSLGGFITIGANATGTASANLRADGNLTTNGGFVGGTNVVLRSDNGDIGAQLAPFGVDATNLVANAPNGSVFVLDNNALNIGPGSSSAANTFSAVANNDLNILGNVSATDLVFISGVGSVNITGALNGSSLTISSAGDILGTTVGGTLVFDDITLSSGGNVGLLGNAVVMDTTNLTVNAGSGVLINEIDDVTIVADSSAGIGSDFTLTAGTDITVNAKVVSGANITLAALDNINLGANVTAPSAVLIDAGDAVTITNDVTLGLGTSVTLLGFTINGDPGADLTMSGSSLVTVSSDITLDGSFNAGSLSVGGQINVKGIDATGDVTMVAALGIVNAAGDIAGDNVTITSGVFTTNGDISADSDITIRTASLTNTHSITADNDVNITSFTLGALAIDGGTGGSLNATNGVVNIDSDQDVTFSGLETFNGTTNIDPATNFSVIVNNGANIHGNDTVNLNTCSLILNGNGTISGNPLNFNCPNGAGTIANSSGNVDLTGVGLVYDGQSLAIIASGSVIGGTATTINLSGSAGAAGDLLVVAGFDFTPSTGGGQVNNSPVIYTFTGFSSASGGNVDLAGVTLTTNGTAGGDAGDITVVAAAGNTAAGTVKTGAITANAVGGGDGGDILVIAQGGFTIGPVSNTGAAAGLIDLNAATPLIVGGQIRVQNGEQAGPGQFVAGAPQAAGTIANSNGMIDLTGLTLTFTGLDLAIIASGDVIAGTATSIDLSNTNGDGGNLLVVAGFDFAPATVGQVNFDHGTVYTFGGESATGGDIDFTGLNITTASTLNGNGGKVTLVANGATLGANGFVTAGNINTSSFDGTGGNLKVIAEGGFLLGTLNTTGAIADGTQTLAAAEPVILGGPVTVQNGIQGGTGNFTFLAPTGNGTIANSLGSVTLSSNLTFVGLNLAIIAANDINQGTATLIDLSNPGGTGGSLTLIAGYDFAPATPGQVTDNSTLFTLGAPNTLGGNINFNTLNIKSDGDIGGNVLAIANGGTVSSGSINVGNVDVSAVVTGGGVFMIGEGGITTGDISTTGAIGGGGIALQVAQPTITGGPITVQNGNLAGTGVFVPGAVGTGAVTTGVLNSGNNVLIKANAAGGNTLANAITADNDVVINNTAGAVTVNAAVTSTNGDVDIDATGAFTAGSTLSAGNNVFVTATGAVGITGAVTATLGDVDIDSTGAGVTTNGLSAGTDVFVTGNGAVAINAAATAAGVIDIDSTTAGVTAQALTAGSDLFVNANGAVSLTGTATSTTGDVGVTSTTAGVTTVALSAGSDVNVTANGAVVITGDVTATTDDVDIDSTTSTISATNLIAGNDMFVTGSGALTITGTATATVGDIDLDSTGATITAAALSAGSDVFVTANGAVSLTGAVNAGTGDIDIDSTTAGVTTAALTAGSDVFVTGAGTGTFNGAVTATAGLIDIDTNGITANALNAGTNILIDGLGGTATFNGAVVAGNDILVDGISGFTNAVAGAVNAGNDITVDVDAGNLTVNGAMVSGGDLSLNINDGAGTAQALAINANLTANTSMFIGNLGMDKDLDTTVFGANVVATTTAKTTGLGNVVIQVGAPDTKVVRNYGGKFDIVENGGTVSLFGRKAKGVKPVNTLTAQGANLTITVNRDLRNTSLFFNGGVQVTADPPVAPGTPTYVNGHLVGSDSDNGNAQTMTNALALTTPVSLTNAIETSNLTTNNLTTVTGLNNGLATVNAGSGQAAMLYGAVNSISEDNSYMVSSQAPSILTDASICSDSELGIVSGTGVHRTAHGDKVALNKGQVLFVPFQDTVVETQHGTVNIDANSTVLVSVHGDKLAVYNLDDNHKGAVSVTARGSKLTLAPGSHLTVATNNGDFGQINAIETISHRNVDSRYLQGARVHTSEFSVASAIMSVKPLQAVMTSNHPQAKKTASKLIKTTAVLLHLNSGEYHHYFKTAITAMAK